MTEAREEDRITSVVATSSLATQEDHKHIIERRKNRVRRWFDRAWPGYAVALVVAYVGFSGSVTAGLWLGGAALSVATVFAFVRLATSGDEH